MKERILTRGVPRERVVILPPWSHDDDVVFDPVAGAAFRQAHGLVGKFVVMYAGNHSPCNPLDTLLEAADRLKNEQTIAFCFVGGGSQFDRLQRMASDRGLANVRFITYRPRTELGAMLSAADLHVVSMGDPFVGILHPSKIYNILRVGMRVLYIGPVRSHISDLSVDSSRISRVAHGDVDGAVQCIERSRASVYVPRPESGAFSKRRALGTINALVARHAYGDSTETGRMP